jgi:hypothetical protein
MSTKSILTTEISNYQSLQIQHDIIYHPEIVVLGIAKRMNHIILHLVKYLGVLSSTPTSTYQNRRALIDSFIMIVSASNLLSISLEKELVNNDQNDTNEAFINKHILLIAELARACEAVDHQDDYPIRATWNKNIIKLFSLVVNEASLQNISIVKEASERLHEVETKNPLSNILQRLK